MDVNDLEMIAYIEDIVHMSQESISTYTINEQVRDFA